MTPGYLIWQAEHQNEYLRTSAQARAEQAAAAGLPVRRRRRWPASTAAALLGTSRSALMALTSPHGRRAARLAGGTEVRCP